MRLLTRLAASAAFLAVSASGIAHCQTTDTTIVDRPDLTVEIFGRAMLDQTFASAKNADTNFTTSEARRLRLGVKGKFGTQIKYKMELNTDSSGDVNAEDAYVQWYPTGDSWSVIVGQDNTHNSFDELTSSRYLMAERSAFTDAFQMDRRLGVSVLDNGDNWTFAGGVHTVNLENSGNQEGWAASARVTATPINTDRFLGHLGAHWRYREQGDTDSDLRYRQRPLSHGIGRIISTGRVADEDNLFGVEAYGMIDRGRHFIGGEYVLTEAEALPGARDEDYSFSGAMITAGTVFGGRRTYKNGKWDRPKVNSPVGDGGLGALILEARYDTLDLVDGALDGGKLDTFAVHADWYLTKHAHLSTTGFMSNADLGTSTSGLGAEFADLVTAGFQQEDVSGVVFRLQLDFGTPVGKF